MLRPCRTTPCIIALGHQSTCIAPHPRGCHSLLKSIVTFCRQCLRTIPSVWPLKRVQQQQKELERLRKAQFCFSAVFFSAPPSPRQAEYCCYRPATQLSACRRRNKAIIEIVNKPISHNCLLLYLAPKVFRFYVLTSGPLPRVSVWGFSGVPRWPHLEKSKQKPNPRWPHLEKSKQKPNKPEKLQYIRNNTKKTVIIRTYSVQIPSSWRAILKIRRVRFLMLE